MSVSLATNALVTVDEYLRHKGIDKDTSEMDADRITQFINSASQTIENYLNQKIVPVTEDYTEIRSGDGTKDIYVKNAMNITLTKLEYWSGTAWTEMTTSAYVRTYDSDTGRIWFTDGNTFWRGDDNIRITYSWGYATASVPVPIKEATYILIDRAMKRADGKEGISSESFGDATTSYDFSSLITKQVDALLTKYWRPPANG